jgi:predicted aconitase with swiveling domain
MISSGVVESFGRQRHRRLDERKDQATADTASRGSKKDQRMLLGEMLTVSGVVGSGVGALLVYGVREDGAALGLMTEEEEDGTTVGESVLSVDVEGTYGINVGGAVTV